ncbi:hypothetical protein NFJ02_07g130520 [Pycnococcus provasolii]
MGKALTFLPQVMFMTSTLMCLKRKGFRVVVYDITTKKCCTLDGSEPSEAIVGVLPAGDPNDRALGQIITGDLGDRHQLFELRRMSASAHVRMVPNSYLSDTRIASSAVTTNELKAWLRARGLPLSHDGGMTSLRY